MPRLLLFIIALFFSYTSLASECGVFRVVKNDVKFQKKSKSKFRKARVNRKVCSGDKIKTGKDGRAKIIMADKNEINVSPDTEIVIEKYAKNAQGDKKVLLNVIYGKIRSNVKQKYKGNKSSYYRVKTKSAVAGVRGTEFLTSFNQATNQSRIVTFEGSVAVGKFQGGSFQAAVTVKPGQFTSNSPGVAPHPPRKVPAKEFAKLNQDSNVGGGAEGDRDVSSSPNQGEKKKEQQKEKKGAEKAPKNEGQKEGQGPKKPQGKESADGKKGPSARGRNRADGGPKAGGAAAGTGSSATGSPGEDGAGAPDPDGLGPDTGSPGSVGGREPANFDGGSLDFDVGLDEAVKDIDTGPVGGPGGDFVANLPPPPPRFIDPGQILTPIDQPNQIINDTIQNQKVKLTIIPCIVGQTCP